MLTSTPLTVDCSISRRLGAIKFDEVKKATTVLYEVVLDHVQSLVDLLQYSAQLLVSSKDKSGDQSR